MQGETRAMTYELGRMSQKNLLKSELYAFFIVKSELFSFLIVYIFILYIILSIKLTFENFWWVAGVAG